MTNPNKGQKWNSELYERFCDVYPAIIVGYDGLESDASKRRKVFQFIEDELTILIARLESEIEGKKNRDTRKHTELNGHLRGLTLEEDAENQGIDTALQVIRSYRV